ncbi:hypothetical protein L2E82_18299 [Cichorium intybus]|uniref:Uncharacterized protein n=1 Tax=Cichorium intybus TaxID=13427 RepID=A0ACB9FAK6_CICIN|nr:hypothetical protein L2E82_18299 [Cichorium intybus]
MDQWNTKLELHQQQQFQHISNSHSEQRETIEVEVKDTSDVRKVQKADREKLRRDKLNEQFIELGHLLDPDRPKNDKASIIMDTIQVLKDLTTEVNRLKQECATLSEESCELTQEKNELREEKSSLKSDIENLNTQYQQRVGGVMYPWGGIGIDSSSVVNVMPPPYSFPVALPVPAGPLSMHPFPFFTNHNPPGTSVIPYPNPNPNPNPVICHVNQTVPVYTPTSYSSSKQECGCKSSDRFRGNNGNDEKRDNDNSSDVVTELELKTPGSRSGQDLLVGDKKGKQLERKEKSVMDGSCSSSIYNRESNDQ